MFEFWRNKDFSKKQIIKLTSGIFTSKFYNFSYKKIRVVIELMLYIKDVIVFKVFKKFNL